MSQPRYRQLVIGTYLAAAGFAVAYLLSARRYSNFSGSYNNNWLEIYEVILTVLGLLSIIFSFDKAIRTNQRLVIAGWAIGLIIWLPPLAYILLSPLLIK